MRKISIYLLLCVLSFTSAKVFAEADTLQPTCTFEMYAKASVGCEVHIVYTGNAPSSATYYWNFDGADVISGSGQGPYVVVWNSVGLKEVILHVICQSQSCQNSEVIHIVPVPTVFEMTGGGSYPAGGNGVHVGLSGSQENYIYFLERNGNETGTYAIGTGGPIDFGLQLEPGEYTCYVKIDSSNCTKEMEGIAVVTIEGPPEHPFICMVTFDTLIQKNIVIWNKPANEGYSHFNVYKETFLNEIYDKIAEVPYPALSVYTDTTSHPLVRSDKYRLSVVDTNGAESEMSPYHKTIHLNINAGIYGFNLMWNHYEGFEFLTYNIYRKFESGSYEWIAHVASNIDSYTDFYVQPGIVTYYIEVVRPEPCNPTLKGSEYTSVYSNVATAAPLGIEENGTTGMIVYPNPAYDKLVVSNPDLHNDNYRVEIWQMTGSQVLSRPVSGSQTVIDLSSIAPGVYLLRLVSDNTVYTRKFLKR
jgi:hypothetical protein